MGLLLVPVRVASIVYSKLDSHTEKRQDALGNLKHAIICIIIILFDFWINKNKRTKTFLSYYIHPGDSSTSILFYFSAMSTFASSNISPFVALGAGCYWGTEKYIKKEFGKLFPNSIKGASVGFMSPHENHLEHPSYRQVCSGTTGHVEVLNIELNDPSQHFEDLIKFFFLFHDPTTSNRQGNDVGTQYASAVFVHDDEQRKIVQKVINDLQSAIDSGKISPYHGRKVVTKIHDATVFYPAHEEHQEYLMKNPNGYCNHYMRMKQWPLN